MTDYDAAERAHDRGTAIVARILRGRLAAGIDPDLVARHIVNDLVDDGWRPIPRPPEVAADRRPGVPPPAEWRQAREALARTEGDTDA